MNNKLEEANETALESLTKHERLRAHLERQLHEGRLRPGDALPTENELAVSAKMSRNTVRQALAELERNGVIRRVRGRGTFIRETAMQRLKSGLDIYGLVIPDTRGGYYPSLQRGFNEAAASSHNQVIVSDTDDDPMRQADTLLQLMDKKVAGIAIVPTTNPTTPAHQIRPLTERGIPVVFCHRGVEGIQAPLVAFSALNVGQMAGEALIKRGHKRVAMFSAQRAGLSSQYERGLRESIEASGGALPESFVRCGNASKLTAEYEQFLGANLEELLNSPDRPTAIFCAFDSVAEMAYLWLQQFGVKVPEEMSLIGFGGTWREGAITRRLTSVAVDEEELGRSAVTLLDEMRRRERPLNDVMEVIMPLSLTEGETLGPAPSKIEAQITTRILPLWPMRIAVSIQLVVCISVITQLVGCAVSAVTTSRERAIQVLDRELRGDSGWTQVHAADALLDHGFTQEVHQVFAPIANNAPDSYRVGVWRVMARAATTEKLRAGFVEKIRRVMHDPTASDRLQAAESLAKLGVSDPSDRGA